VSQQQAPPVAIIPQQQQMQQAPLVPHSGPVNNGSP
jgi:hypothetical protein